MRTYHTLTKKQLVDWLNNFDDYTKVTAFDSSGNVVTRIELYDYAVYDNDGGTQCETFLAIRGRQ